MKLTSQKGDPAFAAMTLDILGNILRRAEDPGELGTYLTEEIRELTGARCVLFLQFQGHGVSATNRVVGINPQRRKAWARSASPAKLFEAVKALPEIRLWRGSEPSETSDYLRQEGFELSLAIPLSVGASRVGAMLVLGLPDELHLASVLDLLSTLSTTLALVLRNAFLFEKQEQIIQERTAVLQTTNEKLKTELKERSRAEEAVRQSEERFRTLFESANDGILLMDGDTFIECNAKAVEMYGCDNRSDLLEHTPLDFSPARQPEGDDSRAKALGYINNALGGSPQRFYWQHHRKDRAPFDAEVALNRLDIQGKTYLQAIVRDITERKRAEEAVRHSEQKYRELVENANSIILRWSADGTVKFLNEFGLKFFGYQESEIINLPIVETIVPEGESTGRNLFHLMEEIRKNPQEFEHNINENRCRDGRRVWIAWTNKIVLDDEGRFKEILSVGSDITERKRAEEALGESEARLRRAVIEAPFPIMIHAEGGEVLMISNAWTEITGYTLADIPTTDVWAERAYGQRKLAIQSEIQNLYALTSKVKEGEYLVRTKTGEERVWDFMSAPLGTLADGRRLAISMAMDITERKRAEEALGESEARFRTLVEQAGDGFELMDNEGRFLDVNLATCSQLGYSREELLRMRIWDIDTTLTQPIFAQRVAQMEQGPLTFECIHKRKDGSLFPVEVTTVLIQMDREPRLVSLVRDITERKQAEEALRTSEERHRAVLRTAMDGYLRVDPVGRLLEVNETYCRMSGYSEQELLAMSVSDLDVIETPEETAAHIQSSTEHGDRFESRHRRKDGSVYDVEISIQFRSGNGGVAVVFIRDITERKAAEEALRTSEERHRAVLRTAMDGFYIVDLEGRILETNDSYCSMIGYSREELLGMGVKDVEAIDSEEVIKSRIQQIMETGQVRFETRHRRKDGRIIVVEASCNFLSQENKRLFCFMRDITERKRAEEIILKAKAEAEEANNAKDQFIAVLSHELRTPLTPVLATVTALNAEDNLPPGMYDNLEMIRQNVELEARLIDDLLDVTRIAKGKMALVQEPLDVHDCLRTALEICQSEIKEKRLKLSLDLRAARHHVHGDATRLRQVFWNLLKNAAKFTSPEGSIGIRTANVNERLIIEITDTGIGIEPELLPQIFKQFTQGEQTRTRRFGGLGLGLSIAKTVVEMHHGVLTAVSEGRGKGATFTVELETIAPPSISPGDDVIPPPTVKNAPRQRILLVEDHPDTLRVLAKLLQKWGYTVASAQSVREAMELAGAQPFDLLVSDLGLPDGSGLDVMRRLKESHHLRGIAVSGFGTDEDIRQSRVAGFEDHLIKPISYEALRNALQRIATDGEA